MPHTQGRLMYSKVEKPYIWHDRSLNDFFNDIRKFDVLDKEEIDKLFDTYHNGSKAESKKAFETIFNHNLKLVVTMARQFNTEVGNLQDLIQEGCIGLMTAIEKYDRNEVASFSYYAAYWIRRYINLFKTETAPLVKQTNRSRTAHTLKRLRTTLYQNLERAPTDMEVMEAYNKEHPRKQIINSNDVTKVTYVLIDSLIGSDTDLKRRHSTDLVEYNTASMSENDFIRKMDQDNSTTLVNDALDGLTDRERQAITLLYGIDSGIESTIHCVSSKMHVSTQRVSQLCQSAMEKMKKNIKIETANVYTHRH